MLQIPHLLDELIETGRWPRDIAEAERLKYRLSPELIVELAQRQEWPYLYPPPFRIVTLKDKGKGFMPLGEPEGDNATGIVLGDFGWGSDSPIVLDYREGRLYPRVIRLQWTGNRNNEWVTMAPDFPSFVAMLGL
jgi:hypothetical protein